MSPPTPRSQPQAAAKTELFRSEPHDKCVAPGRGTAESHGATHSHPNEEVQMRPESEVRCIRAISPWRGALVVCAVAGALLGPATAGAQAGNLKWGPAPAVFPPGAKMAVVSGDPMASGQYVVQLSMPDNYRIAPHFHPTDEHVKVVSGTFLVGMGDTLDISKVKQLGVGDTVTAPATVHHYAATHGATVVEVSGMGPFQLTYVNPNDMPKMPVKKEP